MSPSNRAHRRAFLLAGTIDGVGLAFGWTVFTLSQLEHHGLQTVALYNAAMLAGIVIAAPVSGAVRRRNSNRALLRQMTVAEAILRVLLVGVVAGTGATAVTALVVVVMNIAAWSGYACMRAEVVANGDPDARDESLGWFGGLILAAEGLGAALGSLVPVAFMVGGSRWVIAAAYAGSLIPTAAVSRWASTTRSEHTAPRSPLRAPEVSLLVTGAGITAVVAGPFLLYVAIAEQLWGATGVAVAAIAITAGALMSPVGVHVVKAAHIPENARWPIWAAGAVAAWVLAPHGIGGLALAGWLSGLAITAFEASMDERLSRPWLDHQGHVINASLARGSAARALGGAVAVQLAPTWIDNIGLGSLALWSAGVGALVAVVGLGIHARTGQAAMRRSADALAVGPVAGTPTG